jgi:putative transposase
VLGQSRSTQRHASRPKPEEAAIVTRMLHLSREYPRFGWKRIREHLRLQGVRVGKKRARRLWKQAGLKVPRKPRRQRSTGSGENSCLLKAASYPNHVWSYDFLFERTEYGRRIKLLAIVDEYTRECLTIKAEWKIGSEGVIEALESVIQKRGAPKHIRSDNGPEFVAKAVKEWLARRGTETLFVEPGSPWENGYIESFNSRLRDELLNRQLFSGLREARVILGQHRRWYNEGRIHSGIGYMTPQAYAASQTEAAMVS